MARVGIAHVDLVVVVRGADATETWRVGLVLNLCVIITRYHDSGFPFLAGELVLPGGALHLSTPTELHQPIDVYWGRRGNFEEFDILLSYCDG
ncbi:hypothetical protein FKM82_011582 [Ascaphus truei]